MKQASTVAEHAASAAPEQEVIRDLGALEEFSGDWRRLRAELGVDASPFGPARMLATMRTMAGGATLTLVRRANGRVASMFVGRLDRRRIPCRVGYAKLPTPRLRCLNVPYGGMLVPDDPAELDAATEHLRALLREQTIDHVMISKAPLDHPLYERLIGMPRAVRRELRPHWAADLVPHDYDATAARFERKDRYNRRKLRALEKGLGETTLDVVTEESQLPAFFEATSKIIERSFQGALGAGFADTPLWRNVLAASAASGELRCYVLRCAGEPIAYQVGTVANRTYVLDAAAYDPEHRKLSPGTCLLVMVIRDLCDAGFECLDYGFGDAPYKRQYGTRHWEERNIHLYGPGARARLARLIDAGAVGTAVTLKRWMGSGAVQKIRRRWRQRLERSNQGDT